MKKVAGKIVICDGSGGAHEAAANNASGVILRGGGHDNYLTPVVELDDSSFEKLLSYHSSTKCLQIHFINVLTSYKTNLSSLIEELIKLSPSSVFADILEDEY